jgi:hypothetical protein
VDALKDDLAARRACRYDFVVSVVAFLPGFNRPSRYGGRVVVGRG